jgi:hypothetical protein
MAEVRVSSVAGGRLVLDTGGLLAWAAGDVLARGIILYAARQRTPVVVPTVVIAQAIRGGPRDAPINQALKQVDQFTNVTPLLARQAGTLLGATATTDVVDALVAAEALRLLPTTILTSDPGDMRRLLMEDRAHGRVQIIAV